MRQEILKVQISFWGIVDKVSLSFTRASFYKGGKLEQLLIIPRIHFKFFDYLRHELVSNSLVIFKLYAASSYGTLQE